MYDLPSYFLQILFQHKHYIMLRVIKVYSPLQVLPTFDFSDHYVNYKKCMVLSYCYLQYVFLFNETPYFSEHFPAICNFSFSKLTTSFWKNIESDYAPTISSYLCNILDAFDRCFHFEIRKMGMKEQ
jgi:hypothetical protein